MNKHSISSFILDEWLSIEYSLLSAHYRMGKFDEN